MSKIYYRKNQNWDMVEFERRVDSNVSLREELEVQIKYKFPNQKGVIDIVDMTIVPIENSNLNKYTVMLALI